MTPTKFHLITLDLARQATKDLDGECRESGRRWDGSNGGLQQCLLAIEMGGRRCGGLF